MHLFGNAKEIAEVAKVHEIMSQKLSIKPYYILDAEDPRAHGRVVAAFYDRPADVRGLCPLMPQHSAGTRKRRHIPAHFPRCFVSRLQGSKMIWRGEVFMRRGGRRGASVES
jgi:hypothetical protein